MAITSIVRVALVTFALAGFGAGLVACNTMEGVGKDVSAGGRAVSGAAKDVKEKM
ncbi:MAG TPA: entericidin A/B family lipoprotein [Alphaproteobacteria bacterium]|jgi:predicted small secreted protein|nr:entericidin A/B family lipoprotein [Alphaproteobacteria bacterium]